VGDVKRGLTCLEKWRETNVFSSEVMPSMNFQVPESVLKN